MTPDQEYRNFVINLAKKSSTALALYLVLASEYDAGIFPIRKPIRFGRTRFTRARQTLVETNIVKQVCPSSRNGPTLYRWGAAVTAPQEGKAADF